MRALCVHVRRPSTRVHVPARVLQFTPALNVDLRRDEAVSIAMPRVRFVGGDALA